MIFQVLVGNLKFDLGKLAYKDPVDQLIWIISSSVGGGTLIFIIIIIIIVYKRRSADVERQNKKLQIQLDTLESNVRNECKQGNILYQNKIHWYFSNWQKTFTLKFHVLQVCVAVSVIHNNLNILTSWSNNASHGYNEQGYWKISSIVQDKCKFYWN